MDIFHIQYPMAAFGKSLMPHMLSLIPNCPTVTTLHEFTESHIFRRVSAAAFLFSSKAIIFTNKYERNRFCDCYPLAARKANVIPIGSNILSFTKEVTRRDPYEIVFFGLICPNKGLEQFLKLASLANRNNPYLFRVIGAVPEDAKQYYREMLERSIALNNVYWETELDEKEVAQRLSQAGFAYLWYPDGASERRTTLLAAMSNGTVVITQKGPQTPIGLEPAVRFAETPKQALELIDSMVCTPQEMQRLKSLALEWVRRFSWHNIAFQHLKLYRRILKEC